MIVLPQGAKLIIERLEEYGYEAYAVGGAVRDAIRGVEANDWDICTSALPQRVLRIFSDFRVIPTGLKHGTVTVLVEDMPFEITTFRTDGDYLDGRHPESVSFQCDLFTDLERRDFTVNAICYSPSKGIKDPFCGVSDIENKLIRAVGEPERRFREDALRIMRAIRFSATLGYDIEKATSEALIKLRETLRLVSAERLQTELKKLVAGKDAKRVLKEYKKILDAFVPLFEKTDENEFCKRASFLKEGQSLSLRLALLFGVKGEDEARKAMRELKFSNKEIKDVCDIISYSESLSLKKIDLFLLWGSNKESFLDFCRYYCALNQEDDESFSQLEREFLASDLPSSLKELKINGNDLQKVGFEGSKIKEALERLLQLSAEGEVENEKEALKEAAKFFYKDKYKDIF